MDHGTNEGYAMSAELATRGPNAEAIEQALVQGNLAGLSPAQRVVYYNRVCESLNLNPLTKPFEYVTLNGKLQLYARKDCTDQLRKRDGISIRITARELVEGVYVVTASASDRTGRVDESVGAVPIGNLQGEARANAMMKAETKAKRRVSLSFCGLGIVDESEVEAISTARTVTIEDAHNGEIIDVRQIPGVKSGADLKPKPLPGELAISAAKTLDELVEAFKKAKWVTEDEKARLIAAKDKRKAELASEGEQSRPPSTNGAVGATSSTAQHSTTKPTPQSISDLLGEVAVSLGEDETDLIGAMFAAVMQDADSLDSATPAQLVAAERWLKDRIKGVAA